MTRTMLLRFGAALAGAALLGACQLETKSVQQTGFRGTGMDQLQFVSDKKKIGEVPAPPYDPPKPGGKPAREAYQNVQVLGDVSEDEFSYTMAAITPKALPAASQPLPSAAAPAAPPTASRGTMARMGMAATS